MITQKVWLDLDSSSQELCNGGLGIVVTLLVHWQIDFCVRLADWQPSCNKTSLDLNGAQGPKYDYLSKCCNNVALPEKKGWCLKLWEVVRETFARLACMPGHFVCSKERTPQTKFQLKIVRLPTHTPEDISMAITNSCAAGRKMPRTSKSTNLIYMISRTEISQRTDRGTFDILKS